MPTPSRRRTITLRDGARVTLRPISSEDKLLLAASFARLSPVSRYRRFFTSKDELSAAELDYFVDVDHSDHEAIVAIDRSSGELLGVARYIRANHDADVAEVAVTVADDWQQRGLGRALVDRLTYRARREGVRKFSALVQADNPASLGLLEGVGDTQRRLDAGLVKLVVELPPKQGIGARLAQALRAAAAGTLVPAHTLTHRADSPTTPRPPRRSGLPIRTIVVGADGSPAAAETLAVAVQLAAALGAVLHIVSAYATSQAPSDTDAALTAATQAAGAEGPEVVTHARREGPAEALIAVAEEHDADLLVIDSQGMSRASRFLGNTVPNEISHHPPCSILIVRTDE
jgi:nucleotide-binding universal stress UspA family protein/RimJ/RimL family protein N-acetyltransferase